MLKKLTLLIATITMTMSIASATTPTTTPAKAEATSAVELTPAEMDTLSAGAYYGRYYYYYYNNSSARASADAVSLGYNTRSYADTGTFTAPGVAHASSDSSSYSTY